MRRVFRLFLAIVLSVTGQPLWAHLDEENSHLLTEEISHSKPADTEQKVLESIKVADHIVQHLNLTLQGLERKTPLDVFRLLDQKPMQAQSDTFEAVVLDKIEFQITKSGFEISYRKKVIHEFYLPIFTVVRWGNYLVIVEKNSFDSKQGLQHLLLLDLKAYAFEIGITAVPLFRIPIFTGNGTVFGRPMEVTTAVSDFRGIHLYTDVTLQNKIQVLNEEVLREVSLMQQTSFNIAVNLVDPNTFERSSFLIDEIKIYFEKSVELAGEKVTADFFNVAQNRQAFNQLHQDIQQKLRLNKYSLTPEEKAHQISSDIQKELEGSAIGNQVLEETFKSFHKVHKDSKKLTHRLRMMMANLTVPRPHGSPQLIQAMGFVAGGFLALNPGMAGEGLKQVWAMKYIRYGTPAVAGAALGMMYPEQAAHYFYQSLELVKAVSDVSLGFIGNMAKTFSTGFQQVIYGFGVDNLKKVYIQDGRLEKTIEGMSFLMLRLYELLGIPMLIANTWALFLDLRKVDYQKYWMESSNHLGSDRIKAEHTPWYKKSYQGLYVALKVFNDRQVDLKEKYHQAIQEGQSEKIQAMYFRLVEERIAELRKTNQLPEETRNNPEALKNLRLRIMKEIQETESSPEYTKQVELALKTAEQIDQTKYSRFFQGLNFWNGKRVSEFFQKATPLPDGKSDPLLSEVHLFMTSLREFIISYPSLTIAGKAYAYLWNYASFATRSYVFRPGFMGSTWFRLLYYPKYFATQVSRIDINTEADSEKKMVYPTNLNGAYNSWWNFLSRWWNKNDPDVQAALNFEDRIIDIESIVYERSMRQSLRVLTHFLKDSRQLHQIYQKQGIQGIDDRFIQNLNGQTRKFFQIYFEALFQNSMAYFLSVDESKEAMTEKEIVRFFDLKNSGEQLKKVKQETIENFNQFSFSEEKATRIVDVLSDQKNIVGQQIFEYAKEQSEKFFSWETLLARTQQTSFSQISPKNNPQTERIVVVQTQLQKPAAVARSVRAMVAGILVDKPLELSLIFISYAGATGLLAPIQLEQHSANSWHYLSKLVFNTNFAAGVVIGVLADVWMKLQMDVRLEKDMDKVPTGDDAKLSFRRYFWKQMWERKNSWWENQKFSNELVWKNMKPAFVLIAVLYPLTLGRFDIDSWIAGYLFTFLAPFSGINMKVENALEKAFGWVARNIPEQYRHHPLSIDYINKKTQMKRNIASFYYRIYENLMTNLIVIIQTTAVPGIGPRGFLRTLFFGWTPAEIAVQGIQKATEFEGSPSAVKKVGDLCERIFFNNYTDAVKIPNPWLKK